MIAQSVAEIISRVRLTVEGSTGCTSTCSCRTCSTSRESSTSSARIVVVAGCAGRELRLCKPCCAHQRGKQPQRAPPLSPPTKKLEKNPRKKALRAPAWEVLAIPSKKILYLGQNNR